MLSNESNKGLSRQWIKPKPKASCEVSGLQNPKPGDLVGFSGTGWLSTGIILATYGIPFWSLSHIGILGEYNNELLLFESTTLDDEPCVIQGKNIKGVQAHRLSDRLAGYRGKVWHYPIFRELYPQENTRLTEFLISNIGIPYDKYGALRAGGLGFSWLESQLREQDMHSLFCSEMCAAAHATIGIFATSNVSRWSPRLLAWTERKNGILLKPRRIQCCT